MPFESFSPNMNLVLPGVGLTAGPQYATDLNTSLSLIDSHNHSAGQGVPINPAGIDINADLSFNNNNATAMQSIVFQAQSSLSSIDSLYVSGVDLYFNDGNGDPPIQITKNGGVNSTPTPIPGLTPPASLSYNSTSKTFLFQSNTTGPVSANLDCGHILLRNVVSGSQAITLQPPNSLSSGYSLTFPAAPPGATSFVRMDSSGALAADVVPDGTTCQVSGGQLQVISSGVSGITGSQIVSNVNLNGNSVEENGKKVIVSNTNASASLAMVRGSVTAAGTVNYGEGFTVTRDNTPALNTYHITFSTAFADTPIIVGAVNTVSASEAFVRGIASSTGFNCQMCNASSNPGQVPFDFIAIGIRA